jgi:DHA1 family bicyclomycin/chloramphenicol resistance-like MFS transporter
MQNPQPSAHPTMSKPHIATLILLAGLSALAMNVFLPALPGMAEHFQADYRLMQLSVALYLAVNAAVQIVVGPISDKMGRRPVILASILLFILATLGCIFAPTAEIFLAFRMAQAAIAATMVLSRAAVRDLYDTDRAASMLGYVTMGVAIVPMISPAIGGVLDQLFGWQSNFWLLALCAALVYMLTYFDFGETAVKSGKTLAAQFAEYPELIFSPRFWGYSLASGLASGSFFAYLGGAPFLGANLYGLSPAMLGLFFSTPAVGYFFGNFISGRFSMRFGVNRMVLWGCIVNGCGVALSLALALAGLDSVYSFFATSCGVCLGAERRNHAGRRCLSQRHGRLGSGARHHRCPLAANHVLHRHTGAAFHCYGDQARAAPALAEPALPPA